MPILDDKTKQPEIEAALDELLRGWPHVASGTIFGSRSHRAKGVLFAMVGGKGLILTKLTDEQRETAAEENNAHAFVGRGKTVPTWTEFALEGAADLAVIARQVRDAYQNALIEADSPVGT